jgi:hypothetical protein
MQFTYPQDFIKDVPAKEEAFSPQRKPPALKKMKFINLYLFLWVIFCPPGSALRIWIQGLHLTRIRIHNTGVNNLFCTRAGLGHYRVQGAERAVQGNTHHRVRHLLQAVPLPERHEEPLRVPLQTEGQVRTLPD